MKLKCIGGPNDDKLVHVPDNYKIGDCIRIAQDKKFSVLDYIPSYDEISKIVTIEYALYIIDQNQNGLFLRSL